jgi:hypothetical protein
VSPRISDRLRESWASYNAWSRDTGGGTVLASLEGRYKGGRAFDDPINVIGYDVKLAVDHEEMLNAMEPLHRSVAITHFRWSANSPVDGYAQPWALVRPKEARHMQMQEDAYETALIESIKIMEKAV